MKVKIKQLTPEAKIPAYAKDGDAGMDLIAVSLKSEITESGVTQLTYGTGLAFEIPEGYVGLLFPRSSLSKTALSLANHVGVLDSGYRGEVKFKFNTIIGGFFAENSAIYSVGDKIGQIIILPYPQIEFEVVKDLSVTDRGDGGFGSTGK